jgi:hypothetical protein
MPSSSSWSEGGSWPLRADKIRSYPCRRIHYIYEIIWGIIEIFAVMDIETMNPVVRE